MAKYFVKYFENLSYKVYQEVKTPYGAICDIIAVKDNITICIEVKTSFNFDVLEQAFNNKNFCNYSYIAVPIAKKRTFQRKVAKDYNIGVLELSKKKKYTYESIKIDDYYIYESITPLLNIKPKRKPKLNNFHLLNEAGSKTERMTSFKYFINQIIDLLRKQEKLSYKEIYESLDKHYANINSFKSAIKKYIDNNLQIVNGLSYDKNGLFIKK